MKTPPDESIVEQQSECYAAAGLLCVCWCEECRPGNLEIIRARNATRERQAETEQEKTLEEEGGDDDSLSRL